MTYTEDELLTIYEDVLSVSGLQAAGQDQQAACKAVEKTRAEDHLRIIKSLEDRLFGEVQEPGPTYRRILNQAHEILSRAEDARQAVNADLLRQKVIPLGVLSLVECEALVRAAVSLF